MLEEVRVDDRAEFFNIDLDERLEQNVPSKERWVNRFKAAIFSSAQRAKLDATSGIRLIYKCWNQEKPESSYRRANLRKQKRQTDAAEARLRQRVVTTNSNISITGTNRSTSSKPAERNIKQLQQQPIDDLFISNKSNTKSKGNSQQRHRDQKRDDEFADKWPG